MHGLMSGLDISVPASRNGPRVPHMNAPRSPDSLVAYVLVGIVAIVLTARVMQRVAKKLHQPAVVGEIVAGIALGPTLLGVFPGHLTTRLFPLDVRPALNVVAQLGLVIFM